jgi:pSer/pThr/pTyr-binding forkhead associated (FHA) protein
VLGDDVSIGRGDASIVIASRAVSRRHLRVYRAPGGALMVEDLGGRNGTLLAGARLAGAVPVGYGLTLQLGGEVKCVVEPSDSGVMLDVAGVRYEAPLGPLAVGDWQVGQEGSGDNAYVVLATKAGGSRPFLGEYQLAARVELCAGDALAGARGGEPRLRVHVLGAPEELTFA